MAPRASHLRPIAGPAPADASLHAQSRLADAIAGDTSAWAELYEHSYPALFRQLRYLTGDDAVAEELAQETFARAIAGAARYDRRRPFAAWVHGIALNVVRKHWRKRSSTSKAHANLRLVAAVAGQDVRTSPLEGHVQRQRSEMLYDLLQGLPDRWREAFILARSRGAERGGNRATPRDLSKERHRPRDKGSRSSARRNPASRLDRRHGGRRMTGPRTTDDEQLDRGVDAMADAADAEALRAGARPVPPFAAVMARAHRIDPRRVPSTQVAAATRAATDERATNPRSRDRWTRAGCAGNPPKRALPNAPEALPPPLARPVARQNRFVAFIAAGSVLAAAAIVAAFVSVRGNALDRQAAEEGKVQAAAQAATDETGGVAVIPTPPSLEGASAPPRRAPKTEVAPLETIEGSTVDVSPFADPPPDETPSHESPPQESVPQESPTVESPRRPKPKALAQLDARAQRALAAGDLAAADAALAELIRRGGRTALAEAAFGDRFAIAHRLSGAAAQRKLWRAYLKRFKSGRFADDARAGLCRRALGERDACWQRYLDDFPSGAYRAQAERALATDAQP